jgi:MFS family permease
MDETECDRLARRVTLTLSVAQALYIMTTLIIIATGGLVGTMIAPLKGLATLPITTFVIGTALSTVPSALFMRRFGRRPGFMTGAAAGMASAALATYAIYQRDFTIFCMATMMQGIYQAFAQQYRFAAADLASDAYKPKAISYVLAGGIVGGIAGPLAIMYTKEALAPVLFAGSYIFSVVTSVLAVIVLATLNIPHVRHAAAKGEERPLAVIFSQPRLIAAMICGMVSYGVMNLVMTASPIAMVMCGLTIDDAAWVVQWHVIAMYLPSFFTGHLIARYGAGRVVFVGLLMLLGTAASGLAGITFTNFAMAMILLGLGWNFGFIGATAMVTDCYLPAEKNKVQGINDFSVFAVVAMASITSGGLLATIGWSAVNWAILPMVLVCLAALFSLIAFKRARPQQI